MNAPAKQKLPNTHCFWFGSFRFATHDFLNLGKVRFLRGNNFFFLKPEVLPPYNVQLSMSRITKVSNKRFSIKL